MTPPIRNVRPARALFALLASVVTVLALTAQPAAATVQEDPFVFTGPVGSVTLPPTPAPVPDVRITRNGLPDFRPSSLQVRALPTGQLCTPVRASLTITNRSGIRQVVTDGSEVIARIPAGTSRSICVGPDDDTLVWSLRSTPTTTLTLAVTGAVTPPAPVDPPVVAPARQERVAIDLNAPAGFDPPLVQVRSTPTGVACTEQTAGLLLTNQTPTAQTVTRLGTAVATLQPGGNTPVCFAPPGGLGSVASATFRLESDPDAQLFILVF